MRLNSIKDFFLKARKAQNIKIRNSDVFLVSYPKSGNTWMRFLLINYLFNKEKLPLVYDELEQYIPSVHKSSYSEINALKGERIIKSHFVHTEYPKIIYVVRDGRDALVSYYYFLKDLKGYQGSFEDFYHKKLNSDIGPWAEHVQLALNYQQQYPENIYFVKYEDLKKDPEFTFSRVISFLGQEVDKHQLNFAISHSAFDRLKKMQESSGVTIEEKNVNFFRKGESGCWGAYFDDSLLSEFLKDSKDIIDKFEYKVVQNE